MQWHECNKHNYLCINDSLNFFIPLWKSGCYTAAAHRRQPPVHRAPLSPHLRLPEAVLELPGRRLPPKPPAAASSSAAEHPNSSRLLQLSSGQAVAAVSFALTLCTSPTPSPVSVTSSSAPHRCPSLANRHHHGAPAVVSASPPRHLKAVPFNAHDLPDLFPQPRVAPAAEIAQRHRRAAWGEPLPPSPIFLQLMGHQPTVSKASWLGRPKGGPEEQCTFSFS
jgi:hypothetical protein